MSYRASLLPQQHSLISSYRVVLSARGIELLEDPNGWHNVFYQTVTLNINEENFKPLYKDGKMGAPTKNIYRVVAMIIIKDGLGCSDEELEYRVNTDFAIRLALGIVNGEDVAPSIEAYYLLKRRILKYKAETGINLMETCYKDATKVQLKALKISGKVVRMDSKLIGSNIASFSRYQIVHETFVKEISEDTANLLPSPLKEMVLEILKENAKKTVYESDNETLNQKFTDLGRVIHGVLAALKKKDGLLHRVFYEQFKLVKECDENGKPRRPKVAVMIPNKEVKASSVQNPNDPDAEYRKKHKTEIKGYVANVTETLEEDKPSLIVGVQLEGATTSDQALAKSGIDEAEEITGKTAEEVIYDGGYVSKANREYAESKGIEITTSGLQGKDNRFDLQYDQDGNIKVFDKLEGKELDALKVKCKDKEKWRIKFLDKKGKWTYRYFDEDDIERDAERRRLATMPQERKNRRNNVESAMFLIGCNLRRDIRVIADFTPWGDPLRM